MRHPTGRISLGGFNDNQSKHAAAAFRFKTNTLVSEAQVCHRQICIYLEYISDRLPLGRVSFLKSVGKTWGLLRVGPEEGNKNDQRARAPLLLRQAERLGVIQPGDEKALRRLDCGFSGLKGDL